MEDPVKLVLVELVLGSADDSLPDVQRVVVELGRQVVAQLERILHDQWTADRKRTAFAGLDVDGVSRQRGPASPRIF